MSDSQDPINYICVGKITSAHGLRGAVKVKSYTQVPVAIADYGALYSKRTKAFYDIDIVSVNNEMLIVKIKGIDTREKAEKLRDTELFVARSQLPNLAEEEYYYEDLVGFSALLDSGEPFGRVSEFYNHGAGDIIEITVHETGKKELFPFTIEVVPEVNFEDGIVVVCPPEVEFVPDNDNANQ